MDKATRNRKKRQFKNLKLMGVTDIAERLGWTVSKVSLYVSRGNFPEAIGTVGNRPVWLGEEMEPFIEQLNSRNEIRAK